MMETFRRLQARQAIKAAAQPVTRIITMDDIALRVGERGILLGMTRVGKSTLAEYLIERWREEYEGCHTIIFDSKPRFKAEHELYGIKTDHSRRYSNWDYGVTIPGSVVIPLKNPRQEISHAWSLGFDTIIAQVTRRTEILRLDVAMQAAYEDRKKNVPLFFYVDEMNNFFRSQRAATVGITMAITSGGEKSTAFLGAAQRPRWIGVEAMESMTKLYWFQTPFTEDIAHLRSMGVPQDARPPNKKYIFYFFDRLTNTQGHCQLNLGGTNGSR